MKTMLKACPFCGMKPPANLSDTLYPSGTYWRETDGLRHYSRHSERREGDGMVWQMNCTQDMGGCGCSISGDSREEAIAAWNRRPGEKPQQ